MCMEPGAGCATMSYLPSLYWRLSSILAFWQNRHCTSGEANSLARERQRANRLPIKGKERVGERGRDHGGAGLAYAGRLGVGGHDVHLDARRLVHAQHRVVVEVRLLDHAVLQRDRTGERRRKAVA